MPLASNTSSAALPSRLAILPRVLLITVALTGLTFAVSLLFGILGMAGIGVLRGHLPDMRMAYRHFAFPIAMTVGSCAFIAAWVMEIRHYRQTRALVGLERRG